MNEGLLFPLDLFPIENKENYWANVSNGRNIAEKSRILFCGICRNVGERLQKNIDRIKLTGSAFESFEVFIYENDSTDNTREILSNNISDQFVVKFDNRTDKDYEAMISEGKDPAHYNRCKVLANCRKEYHNYIISNLNRFDYVCVIDLDIWGGWSYGGFFHSLSILEDSKENGCVTSYGILTDCYNSKKLEDMSYSDYLMYDCFVFRPFGEDVAVPMGETSLYNFIRLLPGQDPIIVNSNFNGLGIYKIDAIANSNYGVKRWAESCVDADHVVLHREMRQKGHRIIMNPSMIVSYSDHQYSRI
jgi:hypothetical protein